MANIPFIKYWVRMLYVSTYADKLRYFLKLLDTGYVMLV